VNEVAPLFVAQQVVGSRASSCHRDVVAVKVVVVLVAIEMQWSLVEVVGGRGAHEEVVGS
jgi:hypothetical protein